MIKTFITIILFSSILSLKAREKRYFHGLGSNCVYEEYYEKKFNAKCVETGGMFKSFTNIKKQAKTGCQKLKKEQKKNKTIFDNGLYLIGFSQGGLIARLIYKNCDRWSPFEPEKNIIPIRKAVKRIITIGTPNVGIDKLPEEYYPQNKKEMLNGEKKDGFFYKRIKKWIIKKSERNMKLDTKSTICPFSYINKYDSVLKTRVTSVLITDLLFDDYTNLELFMTLTFLQDKMVTPLESTAFESIFNTKQDKFEEFNKSWLYLNKELEYKKLYDNGILFNCATDGNHLQMDSTDLDFFENFISDCEFDHPQLKTYKQCLSTVISNKIRPEMYGSYNSSLNYFKCDYGKKKI